MTLQKTLVVWWRWGKEHEAGALRVNPPGLVDAHLDSKLAAFRKTPDADWRWWQVADDLLVERPSAGLWAGEDTRIYYLIERGLCVIENIHYPPPDDRWTWYIHLADIAYDSARGCWVMKDLFCDILVAGDGQQCRVIDLADLADALEIGLISPPQTAAVLRRAEVTLAALAGDDHLTRDTFPFPEIERGREASRRLGW